MPDTPDKLNIIYSKGAVKTDSRADIYVLVIITLVWCALIGVISNSRASVNAP